MEQRQAPRADVPRAPGVAGRTDVDADMQDDRQGGRANQATGQGASREAGNDASNHELSSHEYDSSDEGEMLGDQN